MPFSFLPNGGAARPFKGGALNARYKIMPQEMENFFLRNFYNILAPQFCVNDGSNGPPNNCSKTFTWVIYFASKIPLKILGHNFSSSMEFCPFSPQLGYWRY